MGLNPSNAGVPSSGVSKSRSSHWNVEIQDLLFLGHPCVLRPARCENLVAVVFLISGHFVVLFVFSIFRVRRFVCFFCFFFRNLDFASWFSEIPQELAIVAFDHGCASRADFSVADGGDLVFFRHNFRWWGSGPPMSSSGRAATESLFRRFGRLITCNFIP